MPLQDYPTGFFCFFVIGVNVHERPTKQGNFLDFARREEIMTTVASLIVPQLKDGDATR